MVILNLCTTKYGRQNSVVRATIRVRNGRSGVWLSEETKDFYLLQGVLNIPTSGYRGLLSGLNRPGRQVGQGLPSIAEFTNEWSYTSTPSKRLQGVDRDKLYIKWHNLKTIFTSFSSLFYFWAFENWELKKILGQVERGNRRAENTA